MIWIEKLMLLINIINREVILNNFKISLKPLLFNLLVWVTKIISQLIKFHKYTNSIFCSFASIVDQLTFACLLALLSGCPCFYLVIDLVCLTVGLAIGRAKSMGKKIADGFSECFM